MNTQGYMALVMMFSLMIRAAADQIVEVHPASLLTVEVIKWSELRLSL